MLIAAFVSKPAFASQKILTDDHSVAANPVLHQFVNGSHFVSPLIKRNPSLGSSLGSSLGWCQQKRILWHLAESEAHKTFWYPSTKRYVNLNAYTVYKMSMSLPFPSRAFSTFHLPDPVPCEDGPVDFWTQALAPKNDVN